MNKHIVLDPPTNIFLVCLSFLRKSRGISQAVLAQSLGIHQSILPHYENGRVCPTLPTLLKLVRYFGWDLSGSINYQYYYGQIDFAAIKYRIARNRLSINALACEIGYTPPIVALVLKNTSRCSLACLKSILDYLAALERR